MSPLILKVPGRDERRKPAVQPECPMGPWGRKVVDAFEAVAELERRRDELAADLAAVETESAEAEARSGEEVFADPAAASRVAALLTGLRDKAAMGRRVIGVAETRLVGARRAVLSAQAAEVRDRLTAKRRELAGVQARTAELLEALEAHEGVRFEVPYLRNSVTGAPSSLLRAGTRSERLEGEAGHLDYVVKQLEAAAAGGPLQVRPDAGPMPATLVGANRLEVAGAV